MKPIICFFLLLLSFETLADVPSEAFTFDVNIRTLKMSPLKEEKMEEAVELLKRVFASEKFKEKILNHEFEGRKSFYRNKGLSNKEIYEAILRGVERLNPDENNAMDVEVELYADYESIVLGYTYPSSKKIWMNLKCFLKHTHADLAGHLTHEWLHKLGFEHERDKNEDRPYSVPYAVGYIVKEIAREIANEDENFER